MLRQNILINGTLTIVPKKTNPKIIEKLRRHALQVRYTIDNLLNSVGLAIRVAV